MKLPFGYEIVKTKKVNSTLDHLEWKLKRQCDRRKHAEKESERCSKNAGRYTGTIVANYILRRYKDEDQ